MDFGCIKRILLTNQRFKRSKWFACGKKKRPMFKEGILVDMLVIV
jgi:hypothetical protein